ncbi:DUF805 domain-containing protein [Enterovibrio nigricans]|uniref:DUF805 domain-containing protein n=1 Tax=Enterovibrio nigricans DSM 22720 TaxID=1121868 RepID=A0A1T4V047_9GAMM|nr:DUF805 domain-containing protein [Enterovibrio nigricans]SKA58284.1 hypothetical protein SAMN02745132_02917 [Enterovibrio nigricans DSM 22720]
MRCSSCGGDFPREDLRLVESSRYCGDCKTSLFAPARKKVSEHLVESLEKKEKAKVKTPRMGRVEYLINSFLACILLPVFMNGYIDENSKLSMFGYSIENADVHFYFINSWLWGVSCVLAWLYTISRVKDLCWPQYLSFVLWVPIIRWVLFFKVGDSEENIYGPAPKKPSTIKVFSSVVSSVLLVVFDLIVAVSALTLLWNIL